MTATVWIVMVVGGALTFLERFSFMAVARRTTAVPPEIRRVLRMIPAAALAALVAPAVLRGSNAEGSIDLLDPRVLAAAVAMVTMWWTRQTLATLVVGMTVLLGLHALR